MSQCVFANHHLPSIAPSILLPLSTTVCSLSVHLCHVLDSTCKWYHMVFVSSWLISFSRITSKSIHVAENGIISSFYGRVVCYCISVPHLYQFIYWWIFRWFCVLAIVNSATMNIGGACIFSNNAFLWVYAQEWDCSIIWHLCFHFFVESPYCSP